MQVSWERRRILIWGKTRPELSKTYREVVCTGGVFADTRRLVRLYPIPLRYLDDERVFKKYQWIEASVAKNPSDVRPESYKIRADDITVLDFVPTEKGNWDARAEWILHPDNIYQSVEALQERQMEDKTSLGLIKPKTVVDIQAEKVNPQEREDFKTRYDGILQQLELPLDPDTGREIKPLSAPDYRFKMRFRCDDDRCTHDHIFSILDWELDALYFRLKQDNHPPDVAAREIITNLWKKVFSEDKDYYIFLGNIFSHPQIFTVVGLWYPKKSDGKQLSLFDFPAET
jgi:hypothetical protein